MTVTALTTTFTPAPSCFSQFYQLDNADGMTCGSEICKYFQLGPLSPSPCFPSGWQSASTAYFSPGICPSGYTQACSSVVSIASIVETRATCCPSGYACMTGSAWPWYTTDLCGFNSPKTTTYEYTTSVSGGGWATSTWDGVAGINAYGVQVRFQATDFQSTAPETATASTKTDVTSGANTGQSNTGATSPATVTATATTSSSDINGFVTVSNGATITETSSLSSTNTSTPVSQDSSNSTLSPGVKAAIAIGSVIAFLLVVLIGLLFYRIRSRKNKAEPSSYALSNEKEVADGLPRPVFGRAELVGNYGAKELPAVGRSLVELPADPHRSQYGYGITLHEK